MLSDLNRVDFTNVQEQASWVCNPCNADTVRIIEVKNLMGVWKNIFSNIINNLLWWWKNIIYFDPFQNEFKRTLEAESSLEIWATWLESVVDKVNIRYNYSKLHARAHDIKTMVWYVLLKRNLNSPNSILFSGCWISANS